jgi:hypothetical protein
MIFSARASETFRCSHCSRSLRFQTKDAPFVRAFLLHFWAHDSENYTAAEAAPVPIGHE